MNLLPCFLPSPPLPSQCLHPLPFRLHPPHRPKFPYIPPTKRIIPPRACEPPNLTPPPPIILPTSSHSNNFPSSTSAPPISLSRISNQLWSFSRPHTLYGSLLSVISLTTLSRQLHPPVPLPLALSSFFTALFPSLLINIYIVGLNQLFDIDIDKINKPFLPLPAGTLSKPDAITIIFTSLCTGLSFCLFPHATPALRLVLIGSTLLGTLYSMPPFRLKRFALLASIAILTVRGILVNICFFLHAAAAAPSSAPFLPLTPFHLPPLVLFATLFFMLFGIVIALLKDAPDIRGDRMYGIRTFSVRLGPRAVFSACANVLVLMFVAAAAFYFCNAKTMLGGVLAAVAHLLMAAVLAKRAAEVDTEKSEEISSFYMFSWKAFYMEYILLPMAAL